MVSKYWYYSDCELNEKISFLFQYVCKYACMYVCTGQFIWRRKYIMTNDKGACLKPKTTTVLSISKFYFATR